MCEERWCSGGEEPDVSAPPPVADAEPVMAPDAGIMDAEVPAPDAESGSEAGAMAAAALRDERGDHEGGARRRTTGHGAYHRWGQGFKPHNGNP